MNDDDLIAWLRDLAAVLGKEAIACAADRIEALVKERNIAQHQARMRKAFIEEARDERDRAEARAEQLAATCERLEAALRETTQVLRQCTFPYIRVKGKYLDREEVVSRADAVLKGAKP